MSDRPRPKLAGLGVEFGSGIDAECRRYEANWREGLRPRIVEDVIEVGEKGRPTPRAKEHSSVRVSESAMRISR
jgi:hypothetical protein